MEKAGGCDPGAVVGGVRLEADAPGLEEDMATLSSTLAWRISWTEEAGGLQSTGSQRVRHKAI